jgi:hypothetical protein
VIVIRVACPGPADRCGCDACKAGGVTECTITERRWALLQQVGLDELAEDNGLQLIAYETN